MPSWQNTVLLYFRVRRRFTIYNLFFSGLLPRTPDPLISHQGVAPGTHPGDFPVRDRPSPIHLFPNPGSVWNNIGHDSDLECGGIYT